MKTVGIYLFNNVEVLDFAGPFEVFTTAQRLHVGTESTMREKLFEVITVAEKQGTVTTRGGLRVTAAHGIEYHPHIDVLLVPGGVVEAQMNNPSVISWLRSMSERADITASICTGVFLLASAGLVDGMSVTTHWQDLEALQEQFPALDVQEKVRWVDNGHILTSAGISAGIDMSLYLVARLAGESHAERTARQMEYERR